MNLAGLPIFLLYGLAAYVARRGGIVAGLTRQLGDYGFGIYLIHPIVLTLLGLWADSVGLGYASWQRYPVLFVATLSLSYVCARLLGMLPFATWIVGKQPAPRRRLPVPEPETASTLALRS